MSSTTSERNRATWSSNSQSSSEGGRRKDWYWSLVAKGFSRSGRRVHPVRRFLYFHLEQHIGNGVTGHT